MTASPRHGIMARWHRTTSTLEYFLPHLCSTVDSATSVLGTILQGVLFLYGFLKTGDSCTQSVGLCKDQTFFWVCCSILLSYELC